MFPKTQENIIIEQSNNSERTSRSFLFDFSIGDFVIKDGKLVGTDDITIWIEKILRTEKGRVLAKWQSIIYVIGKNES